MLSLVLGSWLAASPVPSTTVRLADLLREARGRNPEVLAAAAQARAAAASVSPAGALDDPMLMLQLWNAPVDFSTVPLMVQLSQAIPLGGKRDARREAADADWRAAQANAAAKVKDVETSVAKTYFDLFMAERTLRVDQGIEKTLREMREVAASRVASGRGEQVDELKAQAEILKVQAELETATAQRASANAQLAVLLDRDPGTPLGQTTEPALLQSLAAEAELRTRALDTRPELLAARQAIASAEAQLRLAHAANVPDVSVSAALMHSFGAPGQNNFLFAGVQGNLPVFIHSKTDGRIDSASSQVEAMRQMEHSLHLRILGEVADAYAKVRAEERLVALHHQLIPVAQETLESALASYAAGRTGFLTVLDSERELQMHTLDLAMHLASYEQHLAELEHAVGTPLGLAAAAEAGHLESHDLEHAP
jgi:cobalt-zinc-cadmium efflux system outer membrane protein